MLQFNSQFDRSRLDFSKDYEGHLMVSMEASDVEFERTPVCVILVLDVSGSMGGPCKSGQLKIDAVKDVAARIVRNLAEHDRIAVVAYDSHVTVLQATVSAGNREPVLRAIERLTPGSCTNLSGGLLKGLHEASLPEFDGVRRVMLLSDGLPNEGVLDQAGLLGLVKERDGRVTLSTFGFGLDADQELLADMAKAGGGNYYYIEGGGDIGNLFARELGGIVSCVAQNIEVEIAPNRGNRVLEVLNDLDVEEREGKALIRVGDIYSGEIKRLLVRMRLSKPRGKPKDRPFSIAHVAASFDDLKEKSSRSVTLNPKVRWVKPGEAEEDAVLEVAEQVALIEASRAQIRAVQLADAGDFGQAQDELQKTGKRLAVLVKKGSTIMPAVLLEFDEALKRFVPAQYDRSYGTRLSHAARAATRQRVTSGAADVPGSFDHALYTSASQRCMEAAFRDPDKAKEKEKGENRKGVRKWIDKIQEKAGFSKRRKSRR